MKIELDEENSARYLLTMAHIMHCETCGKCLGEFLEKQIKTSKI